MFNFTFSVEPLKKTVTTIKALFNEINLVFHQNHVDLCAVDHLKVAALRLIIYPNDEDLVPSPQTTVFGVQVSDLQSILKHAKGDDKITFFTDEEDILKVKIQSSKDKYTSVSSIKNKVIPMTSFHIPKWGAVANVSHQTIVAVGNSLGSIHGDVEVSLNHVMDKSGITFSTGKHAPTSIFYDLEDLEWLVHSDFKFKFEYMVKYMNKFTKKAINPSLNLCFKEGGTLGVQFENIEGKGGELLLMLNPLQTVEGIN